MEAREDLPSLSFGPFVLDRARKQLLEDGRPVRLGGRAFDLLAALTERAGEVLSRKELEARVWPQTVVEETSLRVHVAALRKILGDGVGGARYIANVPGRGYSFVVAVAALEAGREAPAAPPQARAAADAPPAARRRHNLPARLSHTIGRTAVTRALGERLATRRLVSIVGPGGMGKTTVALEVAEGLLERYPDGVWFVDLAPLADPARVPLALASALGISVSAEDPWATLRHPLRDARMLIVLDNCEHVVEAAATLAERVLREGAGVHILATSREALEAEGEWVHRLAALETPLPDDGIRLERALAYPAIQLFAERAGANSDTFALTDANLEVVARLCRQLDGMPLAIELAAGRIDSLGLQGVAERIGEMFALLTRGRRTALPRHRTLRALLEWSHELLNEVERVVLRRLAVFPATFTLEAASAVLADDVLPSASVVDGVIGLAAKSLVAVDVSDETVLYRLLYTTRSFAAEKLAQAGETQRLCAVHAAHLEAVLARSPRLRDTLPIAEWLQRHGRLMDDVRAGLDWAFAPAGDALLGVRLTTAALDLVYELGLLDEYRARVDGAMEVVAALRPPQPALELRLRAARSFLHTQTRGRDFSRAENLARILELTGQLDSAPQRIEAMFGLCANAFGVGEYREVAEVARRIKADAPDPDGPVAVLLADRFLALSHHYLGEHAAARTLAGRVLHYPVGNAYREYIGHIPKTVSMRILLARALWLQGACDRAVQVAAEAVDLAADANPQALSQALAMGAIPIALWRGEDERAGAMVDRLLALASRQSQAYWQSWGRSYRRVLAARAGGGVLRLELDASPEALSGPPELDMLGTLAEVAVTAAGIARVEQGQVGWCAPEILRAAAANTLRDAPHAAEAAQATLVRALEMARAQGALSWELRAATSLARLWRDQGRRADAHRLVAAAHARFDEGLDTADLVAARALADELG